MSITVSGDTLTETTEVKSSVQTLKARKKAIGDEIDTIHLEPDFMQVPTYKEARIQVLKDEQKKITDTLKAVNIT